MLVATARERARRLASAIASDEGRIERRVTLDDLRSLGAPTVRSGDADATFDDSPATIRKLRKFRDDPLRFLADSRNRFTRTLGTVLAAIRDPDDVRLKR